MKDMNSPVSKPEVVTKRGDNGELLEPVEEVVVSVPDEYSGSGYL